VNIFNSVNTDSLDGQHVAYHHKPNKKLSCCCDSRLYCEQCRVYVEQTVVYRVAAQSNSIIYILWIYSNSIHASVT